MIFYSRYASVVGEALLAPRLHVLDEFRVGLRVWPGDVELTRMNNGQYLTLMDLGRVGLAVRCGILPSMVRKRWTPLVAAASVRFRRSLRVGQSFELVTRVAAFDQKYWYFEQRFESNGSLFAEAFVKALLHGPHGAIPARDMLAAAGTPDLVSPAMPPPMGQWVESVEAMRLS